MRAHLKLHEEREVEEQAGEAEGTDGEGSRPRKRRRGGEMGRDWKCEVDDCDKEFKSVRSSSLFARGLTMCLYIRKRP